MFKKSLFQVRLRNPLLAKQVEKAEEKWLVIAFK